MSRSNQSPPNKDLDLLCNGFLRLQTGIGTSHVAKASDVIAEVSKMFFPGIKAAQRAPEVVDDAMLDRFSQFLTEEEEEEEPDALAASIEKLSSAEVSAELEKLGIATDDLVDAVRKMVGGDDSTAEKIEHLRADVEKVKEDVRAIKEKQDDLLAANTVIKEEVAAKLDKVLQEKPSGAHKFGRVPHFFLLHTLDPALLAGVPAALRDLGIKPYAEHCFALETEAIQRRHKEQDVRRCLWRSSPVYDSGHGDLLATWVENHRKAEVIKALVCIAFGNDINVVRHTGNSGW